MNQKARTRSFSISLLSCVLCVASGSEAELPARYRWVLSDPVLTPGPQAAFDEVAVKDPSVVFYEGKWHVFYTARSRAHYTTGYVAAEEFADLDKAPRHPLQMIRGKERYGCAPQIFYFGPQRKWYLIFQTRDADYQPAYATTGTIGKPDSWSRPQPLLQKDSRDKWIDFWVICDHELAYLFYTQDHRRVMFRTTSIADFPNGWSTAQKAFDGVHEAVHVYKVVNRNEYHMIYELNHDGIRSFGLARARSLAGPWRRVTDTYATGDQLAYVGDAEPWTAMVSHGEALRVGHDQSLEYDPDQCRWLIQGLRREQSRVPYVSREWKLGLISRTPSPPERQPD
jgi:hypothetical protein